MTASANRPNSEPSTQHLVEYYRAFEVLLTKQRLRDELRTHFGLLEDKDVGGEYCFFKSIAAPDQFPAFTSLTSKGSDLLHEQIFRGYDLKGARVLDVGFGSGGTMRRLVQENPGAQIDGVNLNPFQHRIAQQSIGHHPGLNFILADYLQFTPTRPYHHIYLIESAFHISDKRRLLQRLSEHVLEGGSVCVTDIFCPSSVLRRFGRMQKINEPIFDYIGVEEWERLGKENGLQLTAFEDHSNEAANHITVRSPPEEFEQLFRPLLRQAPEGGEHAEQRIWEAYHGYKKLHRLFKKGLLNYGIVRFVKS